MQEHAALIISGKNGARFLALQALVLLSSQVVKKCLSLLAALCGKNSVRLTQALRPVSVPTTSGSFPILLTGTEEQQKEHFGNLLKGKFGAFGLTEKGAGSDAGAVATEARKEGEYYILNGDKCYITTSGKAIESKSTLAICASTDKSLGSKGLTMFLIPGDTPGLTAVKEEDKMGIRGSQTCELHLENVKLHESRILGGPEKGLGFGFKTAMMTLDAGRAVVAAQANGLALRVIEVLVDYCNTHLMAADLSPRTWPLHSRSLNSKLRLRLADSWYTILQR